MKKFRITPRLALRLLRELRQVATEVNDAMASTSPGGGRITTDEAWEIAIVVADAVVDVITSELTPASA